MKKGQEKAKRYDKGKLRYELLPTEALEKVVEVYTRGAHKYTIYEDENGKQHRGEDIPFEEMKNLNMKVIDDGADNWRKGQEWTHTMASVKRHIAEWEKGIDFDSDPAMNTYHLGNAVWGLLSLLEYYKIYPQGDNRKHQYLSMPLIGLDVDDVICSFLDGWKEKFNITEVTNSWFFDRKIRKRFDEMKKNNELDDFYLSLKAKIKPEEIPFEPSAYITSRPVPTEITEQWLDMYGFPAAPVYTVGVDGSKVDIAKKMGIEVFVDDRFDNFVELNKAGITTYLFDAPHNQRYNVGSKRIKSLNELL